MRVSRSRRRGRSLALLLAMALAAGCAVPAVQMMPSGSPTVQESGREYEVRGSGERVVPAPSPSEALGSNVAITGVQVSPGEIRISGTASLPAGSCVLTELLAGESLEP